MKQETTPMTRLRLSCLLLMVQEMWLVLFHSLVILCTLRRLHTEREARNHENYLNTTQLIEKNISPRVLFIGINWKVSVLCRRSILISIWFRYAGCERPCAFHYARQFPPSLPPPLMLERLVSSDLTFLNSSSELQRSSTDEGGTCKNGEKKEEIGAI